MPPTTDYLVKLRFARLFLLDLIEKNTEPFDSECLDTIKKLVEHTIEEIEFQRLIGGVHDGNRSY